MLSIVAIVVFNYTDWRRFQTATGQAAQTREILAATEQVFSTVKDAESGQRGYLLTGQSSYLKPYQSAVTNLPGLLARLAAAAAAKPAQAARAARIQMLVREKLAELQRTIDVRREKGLDAAIAIVQTGKGQQLMDEIRSLCAGATESEYEDLLEHSSDAQLQADRSRLITTAGGLVLFVLLVLAGRATNRAMSQREELLGKLDESRQQLQTTLVSIGDAVMATDLQGNITFVNPVAESLTEWTLKEIAGKPLDSVFRILNEDTKAPVENPVTRVLRDGQIAGLANHTVLLNKNGSEVPIDDSGAPIRNQQGEMTGVVLVFRDITERRSAERAIERWKQIFEKAGFGMTVMSPDGKFEAVNAAFAAMHGYSVDELNGKSMFDLAAPESQEDLTARMRGTGEVGHQLFESVHVRKDDVKLTCLVDMSLFQDRQGAGSYRIAYVSDISDRKQAEEAIRESEERFRTLAAALPELIWSAGPDGSIEYVNPLWREYAGWSANQPANQDPWTELLHPEDRERYLQGWSKSLGTGAGFEVQCRLRRASDKAYRWFLCRAVPVRDSSGKIVRWLGGCTDVHDQMESAAQLQRANDALRRSNADLEQFAYAASHDLQEPLRMVAIYTQLLQQEYRDKLDDTAHMYIDFAVRGARRMEALLKDLLSYSRITSAPTGHIETVQASEALIAALLNLQAAIQENGAVISSGELPTVRMAKFQLVQLFQNLIGNALKYRRAERPTITIQAERQGRDWLISVRDNGIGIERQYLTQIFGVFRRLHGNEYDGTGIGLAMCQKIVERSGGRIWAESEPGKGSTFFLTLPAVEEQVEPPTYSDSASRRQSE
ncbi:MAG TPA: PAS domain S-box protein [Bryobacteraceae bacterium]|nr:PAS domain S-box protein [Bryobacteraceae bacterium]